MSTMFDKIKKASDNEAGKIFANEVLPMQVRSLCIWDIADAVTYRIQSSIPRMVPRNLPRAISVACQSSRV
jgi:hypothetical protein